VAKGTARDGGERADTSAASLKLFICKDTNLFSLV
jgi:hypothetical protein